MQIFQQISKFYANFANVLWMPQIAYENTNFLLTFPKYAASVCRNLSIFWGIFGRGAVLVEPFLGSCSKVFFGSSFFRVRFLGSFFGLCFWGQFLLGWTFLGGLLKVLPLGYYDNIMQIYSKYIGKCVELFEYCANLSNFSIEIYWNFRIFEFLQIFFKTPSNIFEIKMPASIRISVVMSSESNYPIGIAVEANFCATLTKKQH